MWATVPFRKTHDLSDLGEKLRSVFPDFTDISESVAHWTTWNIAYRYPMDEDPEPQPSVETLTAALQLIDILTTKVHELRHKTVRGKLG